MKEKRTYDNYKEHSNDMSYENEVRIENKMFLANTKTVSYTHLTLPTKA